MAYPETYNPCDDCQYSFSKNNQESNMCKICEFKRLPDKPTADVEEVKHGEWEQGVPYVCSICGKPAPDEKNTSERYSCWASPYCPHCGAKMDGGKAE